MKSKCCEMWQKMSSLDLSKLGHCTHRRGLGWLSTSVAVDLRRCQQFWFCSAKQKWRTPPSLPLCRAPQFSRCCHLQLHGRCHHSQCHLPTHHHQTSTWTALWTLSKAELLEDAWHFGFQFKSCHLSDSRMFLRISYEMILYIYIYVHCTCHAWKRSTCSFGTSPWGARSLQSPETRRGSADWKQYLKTWE